MKKYSVFDLYVVKTAGYYFICEKTIDESTYRDIFTKEKIKVSNIENVELLEKYYSLLVIKSYSTGDPLVLTQLELLIKFAEINSFDIQIKKQHNRSNSESFIKGQEEYIDALKELGEKNPEKAKEVAQEGLRRIGLLDENSTYESKITAKTLKKTNN